MSLKRGTGGMHCSWNLNFTIYIILWFIYMYVVNKINVLWSWPKHRFSFLFCWDISVCIQYTLIFFTNVIQEFILSTQNLDLSLSLFHLYTLATNASSFVSCLSDRAPSHVATGCWAGQAGPPWSSLNSLLGLTWTATMKPSGRIQKRSLLYAHTIDVKAS